MTRQWIFRNERFWVWLCSLAFGLQFGFNYGLSNQNTYFLHGLQRVHPALFKNDWLVNQGVDYHPNFSYLAKWFFTLDASGWIFGIANLVTAFLGGWLIYQLISEISEAKARLSAFVLLMAALMVTKTESVAGSYLFSLIYQPSTMGALGLLAAVIGYMKGKYWGSGFCLACGGLLHANYLLLGLPIFFCAHALMNGRGFWRRCFGQFAFPLLALIWMLPVILPVAFSGPTREGINIWIRIRSPHHHDPANFKAGFIPLAGWLALAAGLGWHRIQAEGQKALKAMLLALALVIGAATVLTTIIFIPSISMLMVWRVSPLLELLCQALVFAAIAAKLSGSEIRKTYWYEAVFIIPGLLLIAWRYYGSQPGFVLILVLFLALSLNRFQAGSRFSLREKPGLILALAAGAWLWLALPPVKNGVLTSTLIAGLPRGEEALYQWVKQSTPMDAVFLIPPSMDNFRFNAQRAIVIDWKSTPAPNRMAEWRRRITDVIGIDPFLRREQIDPGYAAMNQERLRKLRASYGFDYVVVKQGTADDLCRRYPVIYANAEFEVYPCRTEGAAGDGHHGK